MSTNLTSAGNPKLFDRNEVKYPLMQASYGQREKGTRGQLKQDMGDKYNDKIYDLFVEAVDEVIPGFFFIMEWVNEQWNPETELITWTLPDQFLVQLKPTSSDWYKFNPLGLFEITAKVGGVEKEDETLMLWVSIIHSIDAYVAREVIHRCAFDIITIHDAFRCHPNNAHKMKKVYKEILAEINESRLFEDILQQITGQEVTSLGTDITTEDIMKAKYAIC